MGICINKSGVIFEALITINESDIKPEELGHPLTHALIVAKNEKGFLLLYNTWKKHWEVPGGIIEPGETIRKCAEREMLEETNQIAEKMIFKGLMKLKFKNNRTEYGGLFSAYIKVERPFIINEETNKIIFWNGIEDIGYIDEIDKKLLEYY